MTFDTQFSFREKVFSNPGSSVVIDYAGRFDDDGRLVLDEVGRHDLYSEIQSHAESVDVNRIIERYTLGDVSALDQRPGMYLDLTQMPKTYSEMFNLIEDGKRYFANLSADERAKYNNSFEEFIVNYKGDQSLPSDEDPGQARPDVLEKEGVLIES